MLYENITEKILAAFFLVYNTLGYCFLEKVYENALIIELKKHGLQAVSQEPINVFYSDNLIGEYFADIIVNGLIIIELKTVDKLIEAHYKQLLNYLKATKKELGLLLNFGTKAEFKRIILTQK
jgi:GxxExxY protein